MSPLEIMIVLAIVAIIIWLLLSMSAAAKAKATAALRAQMNGSWTTAPPNPVTSTMSTVNYTIALGPTSIALTPTSPFHTYLTVQVTFTLTGAGGAVFPNGLRTYSVPMSQTGKASTGVTAVANGTDAMTVSYTVTEVGSGKSVTIVDPIVQNFETVYP